MCAWQRRAGQKVAGEEVEDTVEGVGRGGRAGRAEKSGGIEEKKEGVGI